MKYFVLVCIIVLFVASAILFIRSIIAFVKKRKALKSEVKNEENHNSENI